MALISTQTTPTSIMKMTILPINATASAIARAIIKKCKNTTTVARGGIYVARSGCCGCHNCQHSTVSAFDNFECQVCTYICLNKHICMFVCVYHMY